MNLRDSFIKNNFLLIWNEIAGIELFKHLFGCNVDFGKNKKFWNGDEGRVWRLRKRKDLRQLAKVTLNIVN
jgi:hypothetical protein